MSTALQQAQAWAAEITGASNEGDTPLVMAAQFARAFAAIAQAEAAERQAAAMEAQVKMLTDFLMVAKVDAASLRRTAEAIEAIAETESEWDSLDDQRAENEQGYSAGIAPGLHR